MHSNPAGDSPQSAQNADRMLPQEPSIKSPKAQNDEPGASTNGSSIPPGGKSLAVYPQYMALKQDLQNL